MLQGLDMGWNIHVVHFLPLLIMLGMALGKAPTLLLLFLNVVLGVVWAMVFQGAALAQAFAAATTGFESETGYRVWTVC